MAKKKYFEEFGRDAVELYRSVMRTVITRIAADLGITDATLPRVKLTHGSVKRAL